CVCDTILTISCCIHLREYFSWNNHPCFVFKLYGPSIYAVMSKNQYHPFPDWMVRDLSLQICAAIQFLHQMDIIFTDLKPENIVFVDGRTQKVTIGNVELIYEQKKKKKQKVLDLPVNIRIKVVDFGSATYEPKYDPNNKASWKFRDGYNYLIQTRHYRAPEVVLEMYWKKPVDIWSLGCVILEFLQGSMAFGTHCPIDHLNQMQAMIGPLPSKLIHAASSQKRSEFFHSDTLQLKLEEAKPSRVQAKRLQTYFDFNKLEHIDLYDMIKRMLQWFAADRITAKEIMQHRYWLTSNPIHKQQQQLLLLAQQQLNMQAAFLPATTRLAAPVAQSSSTTVVMAPTLALAAMSQMQSFPHPQPVRPQDLPLKTHANVPLSSPLNNTNLHRVEFHGYNKVGF
ncbi:hypothetical protein RFI_10261, partial [Reticulomyxa filosa]